jgi:Zn-dependent protease with chaperone function
MSGFRIDSDNGSFFSASVISLLLALSTMALMELGMLQYLQYTQEATILADPSIQNLSMEVAKQAGVQPVNIVVKNYSGLAATECSKDRIACQISITKTLVEAMPERKVAIKGIIAHEYGHIVQMQTNPRWIMLSGLLALPAILFYCIRVKGCRFTIGVTLTLAILSVLLCSNSQGVLPTTMLATYLMVVVAANKKHTRRIRGAVILVVSALWLAGTMLANQAFRSDETRADMFALENAGQISATQMLCFRNEKQKQALEKSGIDTIIFSIQSVFDVHPSTGQRFGDIGATESSCLIS